MPEAREKRPPKLSEAERDAVRELILKYGDDFKGMQKDKKLNNYQYTLKQLEKKCTLYIVKYSESDPKFPNKEIQELEDEEDEEEQEN